METLTNKRQLHCLVYGQVQGVCFRWATVEKASKLNLAGWVRNRADGSVELLAEGSKLALDALFAWVHHGPPGARVDRLEPDWPDAIELSARPTSSPLPAIGPGFVILR